MRDSTESTALTTISFREDGSIEVNGAPVTSVNGSDYIINYGQVSLTEEQAETARRFGWTIVLGRGNGELAIVQRSEREWRYAMANVRRGGASQH